jgi:hypothetical protein
MRMGNPLIRMIGLSVALGALSVEAPRAFATPPQQQSDTARTLFNRGRDLMDDSRYVDAEKQFREVLLKYPKSDQADKSSFYLITALIKLGRSRQALTEIANFERNYPKSSWMHDVQEKRISLTNQVPENLAGVLTVSAVGSYAPAPEQVGSAPAPHRVISPQPAAPQRVQQNAVRPASVLRTPSVPAADPETSLQQEILRVLLLNNPNRGLDVSAERLKADPSDPVVLANFSNIASSGSNRAQPMLVSIAKTSTSLKARRDATFWLARSATDKDAAVGTLLEILQNTSAPDTEGAVASALAEINTARSTAALKDIARDKNKSLAARRAAVQSLSRANTPDQLATLEDLYKGAADNAQLRRLIVPVIGRIFNPRTVSILANISKSDSDLTVRRNAVQALSIRREPEAIKALEDLLRE